MRNIWILLYLKVAMGGFKFFKKQRQLVTLFSAPKYDGYNNKGAIMAVSSDLTVTFKIISWPHFTDTTILYPKAIINR